MLLPETKCIVLYCTQYKYLTKKEILDRTQGENLTERDCRWYTMLLLEKRTYRSYTTEYLKKWIEDHIHGKYLIKRGL